MRAPVVAALAAALVLAGCAGAPSAVPGVDAALDRATDPAPADGTAEATAERPETGDGAEPGSSDRPTRSNADEATATEPAGEPTGRRSRTLAVTVEAVVSADTFVVRHENDSLDRLGLLGVDAPPVHRPADPTKYEGVPHTRRAERCLGSVARGGHDMVTARVEGATVRVALPDSGATRDAAGRLVGRPTHDGRSLDRLLVRDGFARVADRAFEERADLLALEASARANRAGVWRCSTLDWEFGPDSPLSIEDVDPDAGRVVVANTGGSSVDFSGWSVYDADDDLDYDFPDGFVLRPGQSVVLHTGPGADRGGHLYWGLHREAWDDDGDVVYVRRPDGSVAVRYEYGIGQ